MIEYLEYLVSFLILGKSQFAAEEYSQTFLGIDPRLICTFPGHSFNDESPKMEGTRDAISVFRIGFAVQED